MAHNVKALSSKHTVSVATNVTVPLKPVHLTSGLSAELVLYHLPQCQIYSCFELQWGLIVSVWFSAFQGSI